MSAAPEATKQTFEKWAVVEVMGHLQLAGKVSEENLFGTVLMRVDVPDETQADGFYTRYFGGSSIYSLTPCTEEVARAVAAQRTRKPDFAVGLPRQLASGPIVEADDEQDEGSLRSADW
jgi:hypothetical protein